MFLRQYLVFKIQKIAHEYEQQQQDTELKMQVSVVKIQSLARGSISRKKVEQIQNERKMREYEMYSKLQVAALCPGGMSLLIITRPPIGLTNFAGTLTWA